jgi:hypothetical protein
MVKNAYFCVAKAKVDDPHGKFWIILLGTDRLEVLFGILRTMVGNDANLDLLQLGLRLTGTTEVSSHSRQSLPSIHTGIELLDDLNSLRYHETGLQFTNILIISTQHHGTGM